ncbi:MAG: TadE family protein [Anaerolineales bacterium]
MKLPFVNRRSRRHGQSFIELMLVMMILALLLTGVVEFGFLLNAYLHVLDGAREGARLGSNGIPFNPATSTLYTNFYANVIKRTLDVMDPVILDASHPDASHQMDDVVVSVWSVTSTALIRFPSTEAGYSMCGNLGTLLAYYNAQVPPDVPAPLTDPSWSSCSPRASNFSTAQMTTLRDPLAPSTGILLVEVFYNYPQVLKLPIFENSVYSVMPDPIPVYIYAIMPISAAEPTPTPVP